MKKNRRLILFMCCLLFVSFARAQTEKTALVLLFTNGGTQSFLLQDEPILTFEGSILTVVSNSIRAAYPRSDISEFYFELRPVGIQEKKKDDLCFVYLNNNQVVVQGLTEKDKDIRVFDVSGIICGVETVYDGTTATISLDKLNRGVYIIKINNRQSIKIVKK